MAGRCDKCGTELTQRADDTEEVVRERLSAYVAQTAPVIEYYVSAGGQRVVTIDGSAAPEEVTARAVAVFESASSP